MTRRRRQTHLTDPRYRNNFLDANALDDCSECGNKCINLILELYHSQPQTISFILPWLVIHEIQHPNTPQNITTRFNEFIYTIEVNLNLTEQNQHEEIKKVFKGNAVTNRHDNDATHIFESIKYGGGYFITQDKRIIKKAAEVNGIIALTRHDYLDLLVKLNIIYESQWASP